MAAIIEYYSYLLLPQSSRTLINYLCPDTIDVLKTMDAIENTGELPEADDHSLITQLEGVDFNSSNFIVLHQRGSHSPYQKRFPERFRKLVGTQGKRGDTVDSYDNSLVYGDDFFKSLFDFIEHHATGPVYVVFTSDHGQALGEQGRGGHCFFHESVYGVPFVFKAFHGEPAITTKVAGFPEIIRHYDISILLARLLGFAVPESTPISEKYYVSGLDITYENGNWVRITQGHVEELK